MEYTVTEHLVLILSIEIISYLAGPGD